MKLTQHLKSYGIRHFDSDAYWDWGGKKLGQKRVDRLEVLMQPLQGGDPDADELMQFYEFIAEPVVASVVHSMKAGAISASGQVVTDLVTSLPDGARILDYGCNIGYLTTWYASLFPGCEIVGVDASDRSIVLAREFARKLGFDNASFYTASDSDWTGQGDYQLVVETQTLDSVNDRRNLLNEIFLLLDVEGLFISIPAAGSAERLGFYLADLRDSGFRITDAAWIPFSDLGEPGHYPLIVSQKGNAQDIQVTGSAMFDLLQSMRQEAKAQAV